MLGCSSTQTPRSWTSVPVKVRTAPSSGRGQHGCPCCAPQSRPRRRTVTRWVPSLTINAIGPRPSPQHRDGPPSAHQLTTFVVAPSSTTVRPWRDASEASVATATGDPVHVVVRTSAGGQVGRHGGEARGCEQPTSASHIQVRMSNRRYQIEVLVMERAFWMILLVLAGCASRSPSPTCGGDPPCSTTPLVPCPAQPTMSVAEVVAGAAAGRVAVRGRVGEGTVVCELMCGCRGAMILVEDGTRGYVKLRGEKLGCTGPRPERLCCGVDAMGREVIAQGVVRRDDRGVWLDDASLCTL